MIGKGEAEERRTEKWSGTNRRRGEGEKEKRGERDSGEETRRIQKYVRMRKKAR